MDIHRPETLDGLHRAVSEAFEGISFSQVFDLVILEEPGSLEGETIGCYLNIENPLKVRFFLLMTKVHGRECFEAGSGLEGETVGPEVIEDFVKELTNTIAGNFRSNLIEEIEDMIIGLPQTTNQEETRALCTPNENTLVIRFQVESHQVICAIQRI